MWIYVRTIFLNLWSFYEWKHSFKFLETRHGKMDRHDVTIPFQHKLNLLWLVPDKGEKPIKINLFRGCFDVNSRPSQLNRLQAFRFWVSWERSLRYGNSHHKLSGIFHRFIYQWVGCALVWTHWADTWLKFLSVLEILTLNIVTIPTIFKVVYGQKLNKKATFAETRVAVEDIEAPDNENLDRLGEKFHILL